MKITEKQLIMLLKISEWSLCTKWVGCNYPFSYENVNKLITDIYNQQSDELIEIK